jgi:IS5 family transposase
MPAPAWYGRRPDAGQPTGGGGAARLLDRAEGTVYADRGHDSDHLRHALADRGLGDGLMVRRHGRELADAELERNHRLSLTRRPVEAVFGTLKRSYRMGRMRAFSLARNAVDLVLFCFAFNLRRCLVPRRGLTR